jgi:hypothetical protein
MSDNANDPAQLNGKNAARSWITQSRHHTDRVHQLNVKLTGEVNAALRQIADAFYREHHPGGGHG